MKTALPRATWYKLNFAHFLAPKTYQGTNNKWPDLCSKNFQDMVAYDFTVTKGAMYMLLHSYNRDRKCTKKESGFLNILCCLCVS